MQKERPVYLEPLKIRLPIPGIVSIMHRLSGVALFVFLPFLLCMLSGSLSSESAFDSYRAWLHNPVVVVILIGLLWAYMHHSIAGIRFLFLDAHKGTELATARLTAKLVLVVSILLTVLIVAGVWLL